MTKVGEDKFPHKVPTKASYRQEVDERTLRFDRALTEYTSTPREKRERLKSDMDTQLQLIQAAANEIKMKGMHKLSEKLALSYKDYIHFNSEENFAALKQDIQTLREANQIDE